MSKWAAVLVLGACSQSTGDSDVVPEWTSGTRVRAQVYVAENFKTLAGWIDTQLGLACDFDGSAFATCPPEASSLGDPIGFADAACSIPVYEAKTSSSVLRVGLHLFSVESTTLDLYNLVGACQLQASQTHGMLVHGELLESDLDLPSLTARHSPEGVPYTTMESSDGFSAVIRLDTTTTEMQRTTGRLAEVPLVDRDVRRFGSIFDKQLDHTCIARDGSCLPFDDISLVSGLTDPTCLDTSQIVLATDAGFLGEDLYDAPMSVTAYVRGAGHTCTAVSLTGFAPHHVDVVPLQLVTE